MLELETVTVEHPDQSGASMIINKTDFNPEIHKLFKPKKPMAAESEPDAGAEANDGGSEVPAPRRQGRKKANEAESDASAESKDKSSKTEAPKRQGRKKADAE
jgi:hypothetical protein